MNDVKNFYNEMPYPNSKGHNSDYSWVGKPKILGKDILDMGCGTGEIANYLSQFGKVTGVDFSNGSIELAKKQFPDISFIQGDIKVINLTRTYDYIYSIGVLHHIPEVRLALKNIKRHCNPETIVTIAVYNKYGMLKNKLINKKFVTKEGHEDFYNHPYAREYSQREFTKIINRAGFKIIKIKYNIPEIVRLLTGKNKLMRFIVKLKKENGEEFDK